MTARYDGMIAITEQLEAIVVIDDVDSPSWHGSILGDQAVAQWEAGRVTVRLLEGERAKRVAEAELEIGGASRVELQGLTAFMPGAEE